jgi:hypothetical protein
MRTYGGYATGGIDKNGTVFDGWCRPGMNAAGADSQSQSAEALFFCFSFSTSARLSS